MNLIHVLGSTYVLEAAELIPLYRLSGGRCVLLDSGLDSEREELEAALREHALTPAAILCSHAHIDHCGNNRYFQEKYGAKVALTAPEAGMCCHILNLKCYRLLATPHLAEAEMREMVHTPDFLLPGADGPVEVEGAVFQVVQTPGHSSGHVCFVTPDNVCYTADALMSKERLDAKLPYGLSIQVALESRRKLPGLGCEKYVMAHRGICGSAEIKTLVEENEALVLRRTEEICSVLERPMHFSDLIAAVAGRMELRSQRPRRGLYYERNIRFFLEFLLDRGMVEMEVRGGVIYYSRV